MKILIFTTNFPLLDGGVAPYSYELAKGLAQAGNQVVVLTEEFTDRDIDFDRKQAFKIIRVTRYRNRLWEMVYLFFHLSKLLVTFRPHLVFPTAWLPCGLLFFPYVKLFGMRMIITAYALEVIAPQRRQWTRFVMKQVLSAAWQLIAISEYTKAQLLKLGLTPSKVVVLPMGIDPAKFQMLDATPVIEKYNLDGKAVILTLARLVERKGQDMVLKAMPQVLQHCPNAVYMIAGKGSDEARLKTLAATLNVLDHVIFAGYVDDSEINLYYQACNLYIMPSRIIDERGDAEGFGITFLEANMFGKPVIGGRSGGVVDAIADGVSGLLVDPLSVDEIAQAIIKILLNPELANRLGQQGKARAEQEFNWTKIIKAHQQLIKHLSAQSS